MKKRFWKIEYSIFLVIIFAIVLFAVPTSLSSKEVIYISHWNEEFDIVDYAFSAMSAQAESDILKSLKSSTTIEMREYYMMKLVKPYLRLVEHRGLKGKYRPHFMSGKRVPKDDFYYFDKLYISKNGAIVGIKDVINREQDKPAFMLMLDMNGAKSPNVWGKDIFGVNIFSNGAVKPLGYDMDIPKLKQDCSIKGSGIGCSYYYRIGGEFNE